VTLNVSVIGQDTSTCNFDMVHEADSSHLSRLPVGWPCEITISHCRRLPLAPRQAYAV
jgi:hypothetical protein